jgi:Domain of unknown function (DUF4124)
MASLRHPPVIRLATNLRRSHNAGMIARAATAIACLLAAAGAFAGTPVTVYRCVDPKGAVSLQDEPCPKGSVQGTRQMQRPVDAPAKPAASAVPKSPPPVPARDPAPAPPSFVPTPPPLYLCTSYDGITRESEVYDPNPRCEPLALYHPDARYLTPAQAGLCRWVQDSCVRLSDEAACDRFKRKKQEAVSAAMHAFSDTAAYRKSELERLTQIIDDSCP